MCICACVCGGDRVGVDDNGGGGGVANITVCFVKICCPKLFLGEGGGEGGPRSSDANSKGGPRSSDANSRRQWVKTVCTCAVTSSL